MKKIITLLILTSFVMPAFAITDYDKEEAKYQAKILKIKRQQEIDRLKHPEKYNQPLPANVKQTNLTLGEAQKNIKIGTTQDEVALALGSPNIVTVDSDGYDTWIYDKVSSVSSYNNSGFVIGGSLILIGAGAEKNKGNYQSSQKTLTIVIKFKNSKVTSFNYHMSNF